MILNSFIFLTLSISILYLIFWASLKLNYFDLPNNDKIIIKKTPNAAGLGLIFIITCLFLFYDFNYQISLTLNLTILVIIAGFIDDRFNLEAKYKILLINASNYMDGIDGLLAIITIFILIFFLLETNGNYIILFTSFIIFLLSFLLFNFGILPKQFLGDSGSLGLGFLISSFSIYFTQIETMIHPSIITWPLAFIVFEFLSINIIRIKNKKNIFKKDLNFIFNILLAKYNLKITLIICSLIQIFFSICGIILNYYEYYEFSLILFLIMFIIYLYMRIKIKKIIY